MALIDVFMATKIGSCVTPHMLSGNVQSTSISVFVRFALSPFDIYPSVSEYVPCQLIRSD